MNDSVSSSVLLVDDDVAMRFMAKASLEGAGFTVAEASNGQEALSIFTDVKPGIILMDVMMPVMDGFCACSELRQRPGGVHVPILMMTSLDDVESIKKAYDVGATDFITKPIDYLILANRVRYMLRAQHSTEKLQINERRLACAHRVAQIGYWELIIETEELTISDEIFRLLGIRKDEFGGSSKELFDRVHPDDRNQFVAGIEKVIKERKKISSEVRILGTEGEDRYVRHEAEVLYDESTGKDHLIATAHDITKRKLSEKRILKLAYYDELTQLPNSSFFIEYINNTIVQYRQGIKYFAILSIDINNFTRINDSLGRGVGDRLLCKVAKRLYSRVRTSECMSNQVAPTSDLNMQGRNSDIVARLSGDEFALLVTGCENNADVVNVVERIDKLFDTPFLIEDHELLLSISIGVSVFPENGDYVDALIDSSHAALSRAKEHEECNYEFYSGAIVDKAVHRLSMENELRRAIEENQFELWYQPKVDIYHGHVIGAEALIRWNHPQKGIVSPLEFIPVAEECGLIHPLGDWTLQEACRQNKQWKEEGVPSFRIAVNLSAKQFKQDQLLNKITNILRKSSSEPSCLELELTESVLLEDVSKSNAVLNELRNMGVHIALDDFGTGYSSMGYLSMLSIDTLKIDRAFVQSSTTNDKCFVIIKAIVTLAQGLGLQIIAEGVETKEQLTLLHDLGCYNIQGYYFSRPLPSEQFKKWLFEGEWRDQTGTNDSYRI